jgi:hypothetical protein
MASLPEPGCHVPAHEPPVVSTEPAVSAPTLQPGSQTISQPLQFTHFLQSEKSSRPRPSRWCNGHPLAAALASSSVRGWGCGTSRSTARLVHGQPGSPAIALRRRDLGWGGAWLGGSGLGGSGLGGSGLGGSGKLGRRSLSSPSSPARPRSAQSGSLPARGPAAGLGAPPPSASPPLPAESDSSRARNKPSVTWSRLQSAVSRPLISVWPRHPWVDELRNRDLGEGGALPGPTAAERGWHTGH